MTFLLHLKDSCPGFRPDEDSLTCPGPILGEEVSQLFPHIDIALEFFDAGGSLSLCC